MERRDWNLLVLAAAGGKTLTPVQFQKSLFLLGKNLPEEMIGEGYYRFEPYNYGPFDSSVYSDATSLVSSELVLLSDQGRWKQFAATAAGIDQAKELEKALPPETAEYVRKVVGWVRGQSFASLVQAIYKHYPEMKANSVFKD